jgi:arsenate reductase-like glutaredoxin family protein
VTASIPTDRRNDCDIPNCYACERLARLQAEYQRDCVIEELASMQADIERLAGIVNDRVEELRGVSKERDRLRKALNAAGDALGDAEDTLASAVLKAARIIERALLTKIADDSHQDGRQSDEPSSQGGLGTTAREPSSAQSSGDVGVKP